MPNRKKMTKWFLVAVLTSLLIKSAYELKWFDVLIGIFKIETGKSKIQSISLKSFAFICKAEDENAFIEFMAGKNWGYIRRYGRGLLFEKDGYELIVTHNRFFNRYAFYEVSSKAVFEMV